MCEDEDLTCVHEDSTFNKIEGKSCFEKYNWSKLEKAKIGSKVDFITKQERYAKAKPPLNFQIRLARNII